MNRLAHAWRGLRQLRRSGEARVLFVAVLIAVAALSSVAFFVDRVERALGREAAQWLAADLVLSAPEPLAADWRRRAAELGLRSARTLSFVSVVVADAGVQLAAIKAVEPAYPLRGRLLSRPLAGAPDDVDSGVPLPGTVWVDARLLDALKLTGPAHVQLGEARFQVTRVITHEPDRGGDFFNIAPRLMLHYNDVAKTRLVQPGSRVTHRLLLAGSALGLRTLQRQMRPHLEAGVRVDGLDSARPELRTALQRGRRFLGLAALVGVLLAGVAVVLAARRFMARQLDTVAILRCCGATPNEILRMYAWQLSGVGLAAGLAGCALGYGAQAILAVLLQGLVEGGLPAPSLVPVPLAVAAGLVLLWGFGLPTLAGLKTVPPLRVLRRELGPAPPRTWLVYGVALAAFGLLALWQAEDFTLAAWFLLGVVASLVVLALLASVMIRLLEAWRPRLEPALALGIANITRRRASSVAQTAGFGLGLMALLLLTLVRNDLLDAWRGRLPSTAPNHFAINIQAEQRPALQRYFARHGLARPAFFPMVRGRLRAINDRPVGPEDYSEPRARRLVAREFNLSSAAAPQADNRIVAGAWWRAGDSDRQVVSVEQGLARTLGIALGDRLSFRIAGETVQVRVTSLREVQWDSLQPNFFIVAPPRAWASFPTTYICSFYVPPAQSSQINAFARAFPNVTVIDVQALMTQVRGIMEQVSGAVQFVFGFALLAGGAVLLAGLQASHEERRADGAVLRTLGAGRGFMRRTVVSEYVVLGALAGLAAAACASVVAYVLAGQVFAVPFVVEPLWWLAGLVAGAVVVGGAGLLANYFIVRRAPWRILQD